jgi:hypothetical protein
VIKKEEWGTHPAVKESLKHPNSSYAAREFTAINKHRDNGLAFRQG